MASAALSTPAQGPGPVHDWLRRADAEWSDRLDRLEAHVAAEIQTSD